ncbi:hypothetical protein KSP39_PZI006867 [Platanthera zijinensis]|uniref:Uncharacterized protein n=1 Tax=Platanthera zijinensis TaxID=2320716 RepID=A0AAP0GAB1_9ASPA
MANHLPQAATRQSSRRVPQPPRAAAAACRLPLPPLTLPLFPRDNFAPTSRLLLARCSLPPRFSSLLLLTPPTSGRSFSKQPKRPHSTNTFGRPRKLFAMSGLNSSSAITCKDDLLMSTELDHVADVPPEMRDNYYFCLELGNLNLRTNSQVLQSVFASQLGFIHTSADVDANGDPVGTGEVIFADESTMTATAGNMHNNLIDGNKISVRAMTLFDVRPEFLHDAAPTDSSSAPDCAYNYYDDICKPSTGRWSDGPRTAIPGFRLRIPAVPRCLSAQEEWNFVFTMIKR